MSKTTLNDYFYLIEENIITNKSLCIEGRLKIMSLEEEQNHINKLVNYDLFSNMKKRKETLSKEFEVHLIELISTNKINKFLNDRNHFFLLYIILEYHYFLKQFYHDGVPYAQDKFMNKLYTWDQKKLKNNKIEVTPASPQDYLKKFKSSATELLKHDNFYTFATTQRSRNKDRNLLINEMIELIVSDNYKNDKKYKGNLRNSEKSQLFIEQENQIKTLQAKSGKPYIKIIK